MQQLQRWYSPFISGAGAVALLLVRLVMGVAFILHGWPKMQNPTGWMDGMGMEQTPPGFLQALAALAEVGGGIALILGLLVPLAAIALIFQMIGALALVHLPAGDPFVSNQGSSYELALVYLVLSILFLILGPGRLSLDALIMKQLGPAPHDLSSQAAV